MKNHIKRFINDEDGVTAIEYGLIAGLISIAILLAVTDIGEALNVLFGKIKTALTPA